MTCLVEKRSASVLRAARTTRYLLAATVLAVALGGCKHTEERGHVAGWALVDPTQRHPIIVSEQPSTHKVRVSRGSSGLSPSQRAGVLGFLGRYRSTANSRLIIAVPSGAPNEVAAMAAVADLRLLLRKSGFSDSDVVVNSYHVEGRPQPPIRLSFTRYVATAPECGRWPTNLGFDPGNLPYPNLGCAQQRNFAAMVANPADLLGPRGMTPRAGERRDATWDKYTIGDTTGAKKSEDEKLKVKGSE
ncbi:MAG: CpaD family pilus assembly protein [Hyphomicrobiaceae bacterium]|nr:CpaD family pilus assembly protein [Hyphomicrobiaceae bacterium]